MGNFLTIGRQSDKIVTLDIRLIRDKEPAKAPAELALPEGRDTGKEPYVGAESSAICAIRQPRGATRGQVVPFVLRQRHRRPGRDVRLRDGRADSSDRRLLYLPGCGPDQRVPLPEG